VADDRHDEGGEKRVSPDATAQSMAMEVAAHNEKVAAKAETFLEEQTRLVRLQAADLEREDKVRHWSLRIHHISDLLKLAFELGAALIALVVALGLVAMIWNAREATGLIIQPIKAPPDFAARGLDGTVLAQRLLDKLNGLVLDADKWSFRSIDTISGNWGNDSKVQIPATGVSFFELRNFLRTSLGNQTNMGGELYRTKAGVALTVRVDANPPVTIEGSEQDVDKLLSRAAESLLEQTQPYRYVLLLYAQGHPISAVLPVAKRLVETTSGVDRIWSRSALEEEFQFGGRFRESIPYCEETIAEAPGHPVGYFDLAPGAWASGHFQQSLDGMREFQRLMAASAGRDFRPQIVPFLLDNADSFIGNLTGDYGDAVKADIAQSKTAGFDFNISAPAALMSDYARNHDISAARAIRAQYHIANDGMVLQPEYVTTFGPDLPNFYLLASVDDWRGARAALEKDDRMALVRGDMNDVRHTLIWPWLAYAWSRTGNLKAAEGLIARTPYDCTLCLQMRGRIAEARADTAAAAMWFNRASHDAPSVPFAETDWGQMQLHRGDVDGAIAKFDPAHQASPHFADALDYWGEALILKTRSDLALAKFEEAAKYAPNWGRLHLKWGEALLWSGDKSGARKQFAAAEHLYLSPSEKSELVRVAQRHV
jgi:tetratricopeptide (TPR) repeat protein